MRRARCRLPPIQAAGGSHGVTWRWSTYRRSRGPVMESQPFHTNDRPALGSGADDQPDGRSVSRARSLSQIGARQRAGPASRAVRSSAPQPQPATAPRSATLPGLDLGGPRLGLGVECRHRDRATAVAFDQLGAPRDIADLEVRLRRVLRQAIQGAGLTRLSRDRQLGRRRRRRLRYRPPAEARTGCRQTGAGERQQNPREACRPRARRGLRVRQHGRLLWPVRR
jgi:hypothetical protein